MTVFITGGTGYIGRRLIPELLARGHEVDALVRRGSEHKLAWRSATTDRWRSASAFAAKPLRRDSPKPWRRRLAECDADATSRRRLTVVEGNALDASTYLHCVPRGSTFVHLVGVAHPSPAKAAQFQRIDLVGIREAVRATAVAGAGHFVYVSVAQPAPIMQAYLAVKAEGEALLRNSGVPATILRPWYVLGPGHRWPYLLVPIYWLLERLPSTRESARRLGLVTLPHMLAALVRAVENPASGVRIVDVPGIRAAGLKSV